MYATEPKNPYCTKDGTIYILFNRKAHMKTSGTDSTNNSLSTNNAESSPMLVTSKPADESQNDKTDLWIKQTIPLVHRMTKDEAYRKEVAERLS